MGRGVFLITGQSDLDAYTHDRHVAYIQQYLPIDRDMRVVVIGGQVVHAYWRIAREGEFRTNVALGGRISLDPVPEPAAETGGKLKHLVEIAVVDRTIPPHGDHRTAHHMTRSSWIEVVREQLQVLVQLALFPQEHRVTFDGNVRDLCPC